MKKWVVNSLTAQLYSLSFGEGRGEAVNVDVEFIFKVFLLFRLNLAEIDGVSGCFYLDACIQGKGHRYGIRDKVSD